MTVGDSIVRCAQTRRSGAARDLRNATIGNAEVSRLDRLISQDNLDPLDAARTLARGE
ncbi:hypothetical protein [Burkholderia ubonensis]|uniref:hypothetical protein n=1 Tax=Burkholderia ubonensis TaxID=101571 RepID=UPI0015C3C8CE